jgi:hypothetical protein
VLLLDARGEALKIRLAGGEFRERLNREITGLDWLALQPEPCRPRWANGVRLMLAQPCGVHLQHPEADRTHRVESVLLPLRSVLTGAPDLLFGAVVAYTPEDEEAAAGESLRFIDLGGSVPPLTALDQPPPAG